MKLKRIIASMLSASMLLGSAVMLGVTASAESNATNADHRYKLYDAQTDRQDDIFQYHFAGGTDAFMSGYSKSGKAYDAYLWVPPSVAPGSLRGLVAIKANLIEVPFVYSAKLKDMLKDKGFGILFIVCQKDNMRYNTTLANFNTRKDYAGNALYSDTDKIDNNLVFTTDGKDAADIMNDILSGIAGASGYSEIKDNTPLITIGHSAASPFGYRSGNWNKNRIIAQVQMKNGMGGPVYNSNKGMVPGIPSLQYAAQYTEHAMGADRDRSIRDARWHITNQRSVNKNMLVSHIIEWGSGHYDWSDNATDMMVKYIEKAIDYRVPSGFTGGNAAYTLNDLTSTGYLMKPFEKDGNTERPVNYYKDTLKGWLSSGKDNSGASDADKKASFWFFDKDFADKVNAFTNYAIPASPDSKGTNISGNTYSEIEPFMLMKDPSVPTRAKISGASPDQLSAYTEFATNPFSRYGGKRFVDYVNIGNSTATAQGAVQGYGDLTVDTYYMNKIPSITGTKDGTTLNAYDGAGNTAYVPTNATAQFVPLMAPYEVVKTELLNINGMEKDNGTETENIEKAYRTTLRYHNNRVYYSAGCWATNDYSTGYGNQSTLDSFGMILSPEVKSGDTVASAFKVTGAQMDVPYVDKGSQTLTLNNIPNVNIKDANAAKTFDVTYTSSDSDLQKYTDVFVEYGPARAVRTVSDAGYSWKIEILEDQIPKDAKYPIPVNVVASNLGKWETVSGATASQVFYITDKDTKSGVYLDDKVMGSFDTAFDNVADSNAHTITLYSDASSGSRRNMTDTTNISVVNGDFASTLSETGDNMMFLLQNTANTNPQLTFGNSELTSTNADTALTVKAKSDYFTAEINYGAVNLHHGAIITGGSPANGGAFDIKSSGTVNMDGGIISGNKATGNNGGGGICIRGYGTINMSGGKITSNVSDKEKGGGVAVHENGSFNMSGGTITGNTGYDVYVNNNNMKMSGSAKIGSLYLASGKTITVNGAFTTAGSHAEITPGAYTEGATLVTYADGLTPSTSDFTVVANGDTAWYTYVDGQSLKLTATTPHTITNGGNVTVQKEAAKGETVKVTVPDNYVANSLVVSGINPSAFTKVSNTQYSFTMPDNAVTVSCLVNNDPNKVIVVGINKSYYAKNNEPMSVEFDVPDLDKGYVYKSAVVNVPCRKTNDHVLNMKASMNQKVFDIANGAAENLSFEIIAGQKNTLEITNEHAEGVDYYSYNGGWNQSGYDYYQTASNLSTLTLTKAVSAATTEITGVDMTGATQNNDAKGYYFKDLTIPSWNPTLKWQITFTDDKTATKSIGTSLSGGGSVSIGLVLYGKLGDYTTEDIKTISIVE